MSTLAPSQEEPLAAVADLLARLAAGDTTVRCAPSGTGDALDAIATHINTLAATLASQHKEHQQAEEHSNELLDVMMSLAALDYTQRASVREDDSLFDALATGLNILADELLAGQADRSRLQEEIILSQSAIIQELSTPLIPINNDILVMPLIGNIDSTRAQRIVERVLEGAAQSRARTIILDITGVAIVDTQVANALLQAAQAVQLIGSQVILTGIRPEVAQTLVNLGINLRGLITWSSLQMGIADAMRRKY